MRFHPWSDGNLFYLMSGLADGWMCLGCILQPFERGKEEGKGETICQVDRQTGAQAVESVIAIGIGNWENSAASWAVQYIRGSLFRTELLRIMGRIWGVGAAVGYSWFTACSTTVPLALGSLCFHWPRLSLLSLEPGHEKHSNTILNYVLIKQHSNTLEGNRTGLARASFENKCHQVCE